MKCELKDTFQFDNKACMSLLPERLMFESFGLSADKATKAAIEYFAGAGYIYFSNIQRDSTKRIKKMTGWIGKQIVKPMMNEQTREAVKQADEKIGIFEAKGANLEEYISLVDESGQKFYAGIVQPKGGNYEKAARFGGILASLTSLEDMITNRKTDLKRNRYNPLKTGSDVIAAKTLFADYKTQAIDMLGSVLSKENMSKRSIKTQAKNTWEYVLETKGRGLLTLGMTAPLSAGCVCQDVADYKVFGDEKEPGGITCGGIAVALLVLYCCCGGSSDNKR